MEIAIAIILVFILGDAVADCLYAWADRIRLETEKRRNHEVLHNT